MKPAAPTSWEATGGEASGRLAPRVRAPPRPLRRGHVGALGLRRPLACGALEPDSIEACFCPRPASPRNVFPRPCPEDAGERNRLGNDTPPGGAALRYRYSLRRPPAPQ
eukprot:7390755-Prymnesium_polylepis.1